MTAAKKSAAQPAKGSGAGRRGGRQPRRSVIYSGLVVFGALLAVAGVVIAVVGVSASGGQSEISGFGVDLKTSSIGLILVLVGTGFAGVLVMKKPEDIELFAPDDRPPPFLERIRPVVLLSALAIFVLAAVLLTIDQVS